MCSLVSGIVYSLFIFGIVYITPYLWNRLYIFYSVDYSMNSLSFGTVYVLVTLWDCLSAALLEDCLYSCC